jgi:tetratricopeptide (TPR) repeat protein
LDRIDKDYLFWWLVPLVVLSAILFTWSNHFDNGFHWNDFPRIVDNRPVQSLRSVPRFVLNPRTFSDLPEQTEYRPLLLTTFALDYSVTDRPDPRAFHIDTFIWFLALIFTLYALFRVIPGGSSLSAIFATALFALHPAIADTLNYLAQRGVVIGSFGIAAGLLIWIVWPRMLPERLWFDTRRSPENRPEDIPEKRVHHDNRRYQRFINLPLGLYLFPVAIALPADPGAAVFVALLAAYMWVFEPEGNHRRILPSAIFCGAYFAFASLLTWRYDAASRVRLLPWLFTEPWVAARYLFRFFIPLNLSPDTGLQPLTASEWPLALAGFAVIAALTAAAVYASRRVEWRGVSYGIWWFLIALLPTAVLPDRMVEANTRMFLPFAGLALACARGAWIVFSKIGERPGMRVPVLTSSFLLCAFLLSAAGWSTFQRNKIWVSEDTLWETAVLRSPLNARALIHAAEAAQADPHRAAVYLQRATPLVEGNASLETDLALAFDDLNKDAEAERHFQRAVAAGPNYSRAHSAWARWLFARQRIDQAFDMATKAVRIEPADLVGRHTLMDIYSQRFDWAKLQNAAAEILKTYPDDQDAQHSLALAQPTVEEISSIESAPEDQRTAGDYLKLSVYYFRSKRYEDCIRAGRSALKLNSSLGEPWANIAAADHALGRDDDAIAALREVIRLRPDLTFANGDLQYLLSGKAKAAGK